MSEETGAILARLELHERYFDEALSIYIMAVPGGWLYDCWDGNFFKQGTFVPEPK